MKWILCWFGSHKWDFHNIPENKPYIMRKCNRCGVIHRGVYDMCYGGTIWEVSPKGGE